MTRSMDDMRRAKEGEYIAKQEEEKLRRLAGAQREVLNSPITGEPMVHEAIQEIVFHRCPTSRGVWLDASTLDALLKELSKPEREDKKSWFQEFIGGLGLK